MPPRSDPFEPNRLWTILTSQRDQAVEVMLGLGFDPASDFTFRQRRSTRHRDYVVSEVVYRPQPRFHFVFDFYSFESDDRWTVCSPGPGGPVRDEFIGNYWDQQFESFVDWLNALKREIDAPDLWALLTQHRKLLDAATSRNAPNPLFSEEERLAVSEALDTLVKDLAAAKPPPYNFEDLKDAVEDLKEASGRIGKKDWLLIFYGYFIHLALNSILDPATVQFALIRATELLKPIYTYLDKLISS